MKKITVFTPTYNRKNELTVAYKNLCNQTCSDFIWLIVDDGSTDGTSEIVNKWVNEGFIDIVYIYQNNAGKQRAVNTGIINCTTEYFSFLDSDDFYLEDTIARFLDDFAFIDGKSNVAGIMARRGKNRNESIGSQNIPYGKYIMSFDKLYSKYHYFGDTCRAYYTSILKDHLYPIISNKFIPEDVMFSAIDKKYDLLIVNEVYSISSYLEDGYTKKGHLLYHNNPNGYALCLSQLSVSKRGLLRKVKYCMNYWIWCHTKKIEKPFHHAKNKVLYIVLCPIAFVLYLLKYPKWYFLEK